MALPEFAPGDEALAADINAISQGAQAALDRNPPPGGATGQVLAKASPADWDLAWTDGGGGGPGGSDGYTFVQATLPTATADGQTWFGTATGDSFAWYVDADGGQWVQDGPGAGGAAAAEPEPIIAFNYNQTTPGPFVPGSIAAGTNWGLRGWVQGRLVTFNGFFTIEGTQINSTTRFTFPSYLAPADGITPTAAAQFMRIDSGSPQANGVGLLQIGPNSPTLTAPRGASVVMSEAGVTNAAWPASRNATVRFSTIYMRVSEDLPPDFGSVSGGEGF